MKIRVVENVSVKRTYVVDAESNDEAYDKIMNGNEEPVSVEDDDGGCWNYERLYPVVNPYGVTEKWDIWEIQGAVNRGANGEKYVPAEEMRNNLDLIAKLLEERTDCRLDRNVKW